MTPKETLVKNFSRCAARYDTYAGVQRLAAARLIGTLAGLSPARILELGCGTGEYTARLAQAFPGASITAVDISGPMIDVARQREGTKGVVFRVGDAEEASWGGGFGLITSNASFQWFTDVARAVGRCHEALAAGGAIAFSSFGPRTFRELGEAISDLAPGIAISASRFPDRGRIEGLLGRSFSKVEVTELMHERVYAGLDELLRSIKYTGARGEGLPGIGPLRRQDLARLERAYRERSGRIGATYQLFFARGVRR